MHLTEDRSEKRRDTLIEWLIGFSDGLVIAFAVGTGLVPSVGSTALINVVLVVITIGATAMGLGRYFGDQDNEVAHADHHDHEHGSTAAEFDSTEVKSTSGNSALNTGFAYLTGGLLPLTPFWFANNTQSAWNWSAGITLALFLLLGLLKARVTQRPFLPTAFRFVLVGGSCAGLAYLLGRVFA